MPEESIERVRTLALRVLEFAGMELVHLEMKREPGGFIVRLYIDKEGGVTLDDCATVSRRLSVELDIEDPVPERYTLEVSSPGLDRPLVGDRDFERFAGRHIRLSTAEPIDGRRNFKGRLLGLRDGCVRLLLDEGVEVSIPRTRVAKARLEIEI
jgi:ribosome maturation factor RimP